MRVRYFAGTQIFRVLFHELNYAVASILELRSSLSEIGEASAGLAGFRRLHFAAAVAQHSQEYLLTIRRIL